METYQHSASFVPKLAGKVVQWLDVCKDDVILDIGCGGRCPGKMLELLVLTDCGQDGVLDAEFADTLAQGSGWLHGVDSSPKMIEAAKGTVGNAKNCTFEGKDRCRTSQDQQSG